jgi:signal transduction histidine kinase/CheY-like chemotaxis protein
MVANAIETHSTYENEYRTVSPVDGREKWIRAIGRPFYDAQGNPVRFDGLTIDITAAKHADIEREQLLASERAARTEAERTGRIKDEFLATLSHELRTPLNAILGWAQLLRSGNKIHERDLQEGLAVIERNARVQTQLIEDLLDMSRIISGKVRLDVQHVDLNVVIEAAVDAVAPTAAAKGVRLQKVLDSRAANTVMGDAARLQQVFWNLLTNAIKFTPRHGRVQIFLQRADSHVEVSVRDTGQGIKAEFLPHVFERFRQADASTTRKQGGLGLGLALVKSLTEMHGGSVHVKSGGEGQGSTFSVRLPLAIMHTGESENPDRHAAAPVGTDELFARSSALKKVKVLVIDDEPDGRVVVKRMLEGCEATVITAASATEGLKLARQVRPDVLVCDIGMPGEDGYQLIRNVRRLGPEAGGDVPAVALTALARSEDRRRAITAGFDMHVAKPVEAGELVAVIARLAHRI